MTTLKSFVKSNHILTDEQCAKYPFMTIPTRNITERVISVKYGMRELAEFENTQEIQDTIDALFTENEYKWQKLYDSIHMTYNPLDRTNLVTTEQSTNTEEYNEAQTGNSNDTATNMGTTSSDIYTSDKDTINTAVAQAKRAYDIVNLETLQRDSTTGNNLKDSSTDSRIENDSEATSIKEFDNSKSGDNIVVLERTVKVTGHTELDIQSVITAERRIADISFIDIIAREIADLISMLSYNFG